jgi:hypothetical protein
MICRLAQAVLDVRARYPDATLATLYDAELMKPDLRQAHWNLDMAIDGLYQDARFASDADRTIHLLGRYELLSSTK